MSFTATAHNPLFATAPQASPEDMAAIAQAGFKTVICNRPDFEGGNEQPTIAQIEQAAKAAGLNFIAQPFSGAAMNQQTVEVFAEHVVHAEKPILAYCRTGTRCTNVFQAAVALGLLDAQTMNQPE
jgi:sulfide:quinone oxidoreductase